MSWAKESVSARAAMAAPPPSSSQRSFIHTPLSHSLPAMSSKGGGSSRTPLSIALLASTVGGGVEPLVSYPFELVKTSQQLNSRLNASKLAKASTTGALDATTKTVLQSIDGTSGRTGPVAIARHVWRTEGIKGFYHGVGVVATGGAAKVSRMGPILSFSL